MALTEVYVDPSIDGDSGTGTIGDPFGDLEYAIEQTTFDTTNGTRFNIKAGTAEVLADYLDTAMADTSVTPAYVPAQAARCVFEGYTSAAGDGGIGYIDCQTPDGAFEAGSFDYVTLKNLVFDNEGGTDETINLDNSITVQGCEIIGGSYGVRLDSATNLQNNYVHGQTTNGLFLVDGYCGYNYVHLTNTGAGTGILANTRDCSVESNISIVAGSKNGILVPDESWCVNNSVYCSDEGLGRGIGINSTNRDIWKISGNLVEGFSGAGGVGIGSSSAGTYVGAIQGNAVYDCTTSYDLPAASIEEDNEELSASPFTDAANGDFSPVDTGNVIEGALPQVIGGGLV